MNVKHFLIKLRKWWLTPPNSILNQNKNLKYSLASDWREIIYIDIIIWLFLLASVHQISYVFGRGVPGFFDYLKALGLDTAIWILSRAIARAHVLRGSVSMRDPVQIVLWSGLMIFLILTTMFNVIYELTREYSSGSIIYNRAGPIFYRIIQLMSRIATS